MMDRFNRFLSSPKEFVLDVIEMIKNEIQLTMKRLMGDVEIKIKYFDDSLEEVKSIEQGDWIDLRAAETIHLSRWESALIPLGVAMELPKGHEAHLVVRSSAFKKYGILQTNSIGIIDNSYSGDDDQWMLPVLAVKETTIEKNDRICQFRIVRKMNHDRPVKLRTVMRLGESRGGFGSTGTK